MLDIKNDLNYELKYRTNDFLICEYINNLIKDKNILNIFITSQRKAYVLNITYEDADNIVTKEKFTILSKNVKQKTDIEKPYISLTEQGIIYYIPYKNSQDSYIAIFFLIFF